MSERVHKTITNAIPFNKRNVPALFNGATSLPASMRAGALSDFDALFERDCGSDAFARAVVQLQERFNLVADGKFGRQTLNAVLSAAVPVSIDDDFIVFEGVRHRFATDGYRLVSFESPNGLDLHRRGHFNARKSPISRIVMHWGGLDPKHFFDCAMSPSRKISSHFAIGYVDQQVVVFQLLDLTHKAWHAGSSGNEGSVGVDICQQAAVEWKKHYSAPPYQVHEMPNPTSRGPAQVLSLDPEIKRVTQHFISHLIELLAQLENVDKSAPVLRAEDAFNLSSPVVGHHHLVDHKWDIAPWWDELFHEDKNIEAC